MLKVLELFSGIGAWTCALKELDITAFVIRSELDTRTDKAYQKINFANEKTMVVHNLGNINTIDWLNVKFSIIGKIDLIVASPPCQGFSNAKQKANSEKDFANNKLSLEILRPIEIFMPKIVVIENVPNFLKSKEFGIISLRLHSLLYQQQILNLNSLNLNWPQHRKRTFIIYTRHNVFSLRKYHLFKRLQEHKSFFTSRLSNFLVDENLEHKYKELPFNAKLRKNGNGYTWGNYIDNRCYLPEGYVGTITTTYNQPWILVRGNKIRKLTAKESLLLMGFKISDYEKIKSMNFSETFIKKLAGNSIVVPVIKEILKILFK